MNGRINQVINTPPAKKQQVAINEGHCKLDKPIMAWPDVQPLA